MMILLILLLLLLFNIECNTHQLKSSSLSLLSCISLIHNNITNSNSNINSNNNTIINKNININNTTTTTTNDNNNNNNNNKRYSINPAILKIAQKQRLIAVSFVNGIYHTQGK